MKRAHAGRAEHARGVLLVRVEVSPEPADRPHDDRVVEEHVREEDRRRRKVRTREREERGADDDGREHERHDDQRADEHAPRKRKRVSTYAAGSATASVSSVESAACQTVNQATSRSAASLNTSAIGERSSSPSGHRPRPMIVTTG